MSEPNLPKEETNVQDLVAVREQKLTELKEKGLDPFYENWEQMHTAEDAKGLYVEDEEKSPEVSLAGRLLAIRLMGKASFAKVQDRSGQIQLYFKKDIVGEEAYAFFKKLDLGDILGVKGTLFKTKTGEVTVRVNGFKLLSKSLRPLPEKWHGLTDVEQRSRQRYLDLIVNQDSRRRFFLRAAVIKEIREFLWERDFVEVETPCLINIPSGAAARPFTTHMNALSHDFVMRIALELYLKRLLVGGMDRVYEIGRIFRNEGLSRKHNPEFTMLEVYQAYSDYRGMMEMVQAMFLRICDNVLGTRSLEQPDGTVIDLKTPWKECQYKDLIIEATGDKDWFTRTKEEKLNKCAQMGLQVNPHLEDFEITNDVFEKAIEPTLIQPTFVTHLPKELCPLAKINKEDPSVIDVFELCINGQEIAPAYSEQNDPIIQKQMFELQAGEEQFKIDQDFLEAMAYGMPPAGGMGVGIDRLMILLTGASNIRDTILFPTMKPTTH